MEFVSWYLCFHTYTTYCTIGTVHTATKLRGIHFHLKFDCCISLFYHFCISIQCQTYDLVFRWKTWIISMLLCFRFLLLFSQYFSFLLSKKYNTWNIKIHREVLWNILFKVIVEVVEHFTTYSQHSMVHLRWLSI